MITDKLRGAHTLLLVLLGCAALCVAAFLAFVILGWCAVGVSLLAVAWLTEPTPKAVTGQ